MYDHSRYKYNMCQLSKNKKRTTKDKFEYITKNETYG